MKNAEPDRLRRGKAVHQEIQDECEATVEGDVWPEKPITKSGGRPGRIDVHVQADEGLVAVVEIKNSDWDAMTPKAVRRNAKRYAPALELRRSRDRRRIPDLPWYRLPHETEHRRPSRRDRAAVRRRWDRCRLAGRGGRGPWGKRLTGAMPCLAKATYSINALGIDRVVR